MLESRLGLIAIEARALRSPVGGVARYARGLIRALRAAAPDSPFLLLTDHPSAGTAVQGMPSVAVAPHLESLRLWWDIVSLPRAVRTYRPTLLHRTKPAGVPVRRFPPTIVTVYDVIPLTHPDTQTAAQRAYWALQLPWAVRSARAILTISEASRRALIERLQVNPAAVTVTYPGIDPEFRRPAPDAVASTRALEGLAAPYLLTVGTIEPRKNVDVLLRAFARLTARLPHSLVIAGPWGWKTDAVRTAARDPRLRNRVRFLGAVPAGRLPELLSGADAFAFLSRDEGFGFPPLEAMACGTPTVVNASGSLPEVVDDAALLVDARDESRVADALERVLTDGELRRRLAAAGPKRAAKFTWEQTARGTLAAYRRVAREES